MVCSQANGTVSGTLMEEGGDHSVTIKFTGTMRGSVLWITQDQCTATFTIYGSDISGTLFDSEDLFSFIGSLDIGIPLDPTGEDNPWTNSIGMAFVQIPSGTFIMGSPMSEFLRESDETQHQVTLTKSFYLQTTEVTQGQWKIVMGNNPSYFNECGDECPVENVSWDDCQAFISQLNLREGTTKYRLPTEAEWEYACRSETTTPFDTGNCLSSNQANYDGNYPYTDCPLGTFRNETVPVKSFSPNAWGIYDIHGNVWEWCQDWYGIYPSSSVTDPAGPSSGSWRVIRGGSLGNGAGECRSAYRYRDAPDFRYFCFGFRVARDF
jgi:formylglycine-generating enzyme required for sulfatase activity